MFDDIREIFLLENKEFCTPEIAIFGKVGVIVSGHKGVLKISSNEIILKVKNGNLKIYGNSLKLFDVTVNEVGVFGEILGVNYV